MPARRNSRNCYVMPNSDPSATPEQVMGTCLGLELEAAALYQRFAAATTDGDLAELWRDMSRAETHHAHLIAELANRRGFAVPPVPVRVLTAVVDKTEEIRRDADVADLTDDGMLAIAAALEFSEMDDLFTAICRAAGVSSEGGRAEHLAPLVKAVLARQAGGSALRHLVAALIRLDRRTPPETERESPCAGSSLRQ